MKTMLKKLTIQNFKILREVSLELSNLNVLTGLNGMGKSSVIQALLLLRQSYLEKALPEKGLLLRVEQGRSLTEVGTGADALSKAVEEVNHPIFFGLEYEHARQSNFYFDFLREEDKQDDALVMQLRQNPLMRLNTQQTEINEAVFEQSLFQSDAYFQYLYAERISPQAHNDTNFGYIEQKNLGKYGQYALHFLDRYKNESIDNPHVLHPDTAPDRDTLAEQVNYWLSEITPNTRLDVHYLSSIDKVRGEFNINDEAGFKPTNVGFGLTYILPVIIALLTLKENGLLIIENPEAHLHPAGQSKMAELIARCAASGRQIIIETHSDHIVHGIMVASYEHFKDTKDEKEMPEGIANDKVRIYYFDKNEENKSEANLIQLTPSETGRIKNPPMGFFDQFNIDLKRLLQ